MKKVYARSTHVFTGILRAVNTSAMRVHTFTFQVTRSFKGSAKGTFTIHSPGHSCGLKTGAITRIGTEYLVLGSSRGGKVWSRQCRGVGPTNRASVKAAIALFGKMPAPATKKPQSIRSLIMACRHIGPGIGPRGLFTFDFQSKKPQLLSTISFGKKGWGQGAQRISNVRIAGNGNISLKLPSRSGRSGTDVQIYFRGQSSQLKGKKYHGKVLIFMMRYPIPPNVRIAPRRLVCSKIQL
tara:strand:+ start:295 stop:1011 length:717 start_codon:yes stop_codon:yes gene_type:complete